MPQPWRTYRPEVSAGRGEAQAALRIKGILLYAVPNNGAHLASIAKEISRWHNQLRQLCTDADVIQDLSEDWVTFKVAETIRVEYVIGGLDRVVDEQSAKVFWGNPDIQTVADRGHRDIVKPQSRDDLPFLILKNFVSSLAQQPELQPEMILAKYATAVLRQPSPRPASRFRVIGFDVDGTLLRGEEFEYSWTLV